MSIPQEALQKLLLEMDSSLMKTRSELSVVNQTVTKRQRELRLNEVTLEELKGSSQGEKEVVWEGVGKMFLGVETGDYKKSVEKEKSVIKDQLNALDKKKNYLQTTLNNTVNGMEEIFKRSGVN